MPDRPPHLPPITPTRKVGDEKIHDADRALGPSLLDFWRWSASDLMSNATRGILAEYLVAQAVGDESPVRAEWGAYDVVTPDGIRVEVKTSAYIQSWYQRDYSQIKFGIGPTRYWDPETNKLIAESKRQADVYVFCVLAHKDQSTIDPLDVAQWQFFGVSTARLNEAVGNQKSISLVGLERLGAVPVDYRGLADAVHTAQGAAPR